MKVINEDDWYDKYRPIRNHINDNASFSWGDDNGCLFETYGPELEFVKAQNPKTIWTLIETEGVELIISGYHLVNRLGYFITEVEVPNEFVEVYLEY